MGSTKKQTRANRSNAKKSTGPSSSKGKSRSSRNAVKHGLTARSHIDQEERDEFKLLLLGLTEEYDPQTPTEQLLIERVASLAIRLTRFRKVEDSLFEYARDRALDFGEVLDSFRLEREEAIEVMAIVSGEPKAPNKPTKTQFSDLRKKDLSEEGLKAFGRDERIQNVVSRYSQRSKLLVETAMPDLTELDKINRYQTSLDRQFSRALGELIHVIEKRKASEEKS